MALYLDPKSDFDEEDELDELEDVIVVGFGVDVDAAEELDEEGVGRLATHGLGGPPSLHGGHTRVTEVVSQKGCRGLESSVLFLPPSGEGQMPFDLDNDRTPKPPRKPDHRQAGKAGEERQADRNARSLRRGGA